MPVHKRADDAVASRPSRIGRRGRLVLASFLMLFVELVLIRWSAANVVYLAYFTNFVLLASFLGIGVGFLRARASRDLSSAAPIALAAFALFVVLSPVQVGRYGGDDRLFVGLFGWFALPPWIELPAIFVGVVVVMALVAERVARLFVLYPPLEAYRLDILGSIAGIAAFSAMSFAGAPPLVWAIVIAASLAVLAGRPMRPLGRIALAAVVIRSSYATRPADRIRPD